MQLILTDNTTYYLKDRGRTLEYPRVTSIINESLPLFISKFINPDDLKRAQNFGIALHKACDLDDLGKIDDFTIDPKLLPYLEQYRLFRKQVDWAKHVEHTERLVYSKVWKYAGRLDRIFEKNIVLDLKSGLTDDIVGIQTAAYGEAGVEMKILKRGYRRFCLKLELNKYTLYELTDATDINVFYAMLTIYNFKRNRRKI